jgi:hypothetical protein
MIQVKEGGGGRGRDLIHDLSVSGIKNGPPGHLHCN